MPKPDDSLPITMSKSGSNYGIKTAKAENRLLTFAGITNVSKLKRQGFATGSEVDYGTQ